jgi:hypothetical protein
MVQHWKLASSRQAVRIVQVLNPHPTGFEDPRIFLQDNGLVSFFGSGHPGGQ